MAERIMNLNENPEIGNAVKDIMTYLRGLHHGQGMSEENCLIAVTIATKMMEDISGMKVHAVAHDIRDMNKEDFAKSIMKALDSIMGKKK